MMPGLFRKMVKRVLALFRRKSVKVNLPVEKEFPENIVKQDISGKLHRFLFNGDRPVGYRKSSRHPEIQCFPVKDFTEAYRFFIRLCDQRMVAVQAFAGAVHYRMRSANGTVVFDFTDHTTGKPEGTLAVLRINHLELGIPLTAIYFIQIKKRRK